MHIVSHLRCLGSWVHRKVWPNHLGIETQRNTSAKVSILLSQPLPSKHTHSIRHLSHEAKQPFAISDPAGNPFCPTPQACRGQDQRAEAPACVRPQFFVQLSGRRAPSAHARPLTLYRQLCIHGHRRELPRPGGVQGCTQGIMPQFLFSCDWHADTHTKDLEIQMWECPHQKHALEDACPACATPVSSCSSCSFINDVDWKIKSMSSANGMRHCSWGASKSTTRSQIGRCSSAWHDSWWQTAWSKKGRWTSSYGHIEGWTHCIQHTEAAILVKISDAPGLISATARIQGGNRRYAEGYSGIGSKDGLAGLQTDRYSNLIAEA